MDGRMTVNCRTTLDDRIYVSHGNQSFDLVSRHRLGNGKLVQVTRVIVVDGAPEKVPEIMRRFLSSRRWPADSVEFGQRLERKIWNKSSLEHRPMGDSLQDRAVLSVVRILHHVISL